MSKNTVDADVLIIGAGAAGLVLALSLHEIGIDCKVYDAVPELRAVGAGINLLPHAVKELDELGLVADLDKVGIRTKDASYFNHYGQHIYTEPAGLDAGYEWPQFSLHRGDMQAVFLDAVRARLGEASVVTGHRCVGVSQDEDGVVASFAGPNGEDLPDVRGRFAIGCDGIRSVLRHQMYPSEGAPIYSGLTIWRGVTPWQPFLSGANTVRIGWMTVGKLMVYPVRNDIDDQGNQLLNFVATLERPQPDSYDWNAEARLEDFCGAYSTWGFDWLDVPSMLASTDPVLVYPMVDRDPLETWTFGRISLMGDAAHPMYPRGSNGAGQAILDARKLARSVASMGLSVDALIDYDRERVAATGRVVLMNRANPPDAILRRVYELTDGRPFDHIDDVVSQDELRSISERYREVAGFTVEAVNAAR